MARGPTQAAQAGRLSQILEEYILMLTNEHSKKQNCVLYGTKTYSKTVDLKK